MLSYSWGYTIGDKVDTHVAFYEAPKLDVKKDICLDLLLMRQPTQANNKEKEDKKKHKEERDKMEAINMS